MTPLNCLSFQMLVLAAARESSRAEALTAGVLVRVSLFCIKFGDFATLTGWCKLPPVSKSSPRSHVDLTLQDLGCLI